MILKSTIKAVSSYLNLNIASAKFHFYWEQTQLPICTSTHKSFNTSIKCSLLSANELKNLLKINKTKHKKFTQI